MKEVAVHLARHGETNWNAEGRLQGATDIPLSETGRNQALILRNDIQNLGIDVVYTSQLSRAIETARIATDGFGLPLRHHQGLNERSFGEYEGKTTAELTQLYGDWRMRTPHLAESNEEFTRRVYDAFDEIVMDNPGAKILIVSHGGVIRRLNLRLFEEINGMVNAEFDVANCKLFSFVIPITESVRQGSK